VSTQAVRYELEPDGVAVLTLDDPDQSANTMNAAYVAAMGAAVDRLEAERDRITGVVVTSAKPTFFAGGDLKLMVQVRPDDATRLTEMLGTIKAQLRRLERLGRPVVAAINGSALGGGLEIALACHHRIVLEDPRTRIGFPEVTLGLLPGAGGVTRTVRMRGIADALMSVLLEGRQFRPDDAVKAGLVDEVVATPEELAVRARAWIAEHPDAVQPWDVKGYRIPGGTPSTPSLAANLPAFPALLRQRLKGAPMPAPRAILAAAVEGAQVDIDTAFVIETRYLVELLCGQVAKNMINAFFFDRTEVTSGTARPAGEPAWTARRLGVVGAGMMGAGIGYQAARSGIDVVLLDLSREDAVRGKGYAERLLAGAVSRGRMGRDQADAVLDRITPSGDVGDLAGCDAVIEAVFEDPSVKAETFGRIQEVVSGGTLLASNTSTLPISELATAVRRPEDFIGMHFFSPVDRMPLLEIVVGRQSSSSSIARAFDLGRALGKIPIVVNDGRGFFTSRVIGHFMDEAIGMLAEGVPASSVEQAALQAGYPTGPLALADEVSLSLIRRIRSTFNAAAVAAGTPVEARPGDLLVERMVTELDRPGRAARRGFYDYAPDGARLGLWPGLAEYRRVTARSADQRDDQPIPFADLQERMLFAEALDALRCTKEGVLRSAAEANVGSIIGIGFPPWTGGVLRYVEQYPGGAAGFAERARELASRYGPRFAPPADLVA
jgi:3-hydroxyacyl-CoA dehydrogenase / enoyl-CoA hydratase / 3-hydroxybutyryl-CoA epimerase